MTVDPQEFRTIIGHFATGVTVITSCDGDRLHGMTANAVSSLSLDPVMVLICVDKTTHTHEVITKSKVFAVNILGEGQETVSRVFAKKGEPEVGSLRGKGYRLGETGAPILTECLAFIECRVASALDGGDHTIFLGSVESEGVVNDDVQPLLFYRGGYRSIAG